MKHAEGTSVRLSWRGRTALALFAVHILLLFIPPIPPDVKGSLWSYLLSAAAVVLAALETRRLGPRIVAAWSRIGARRKWIMGLGLVAVSLVVTSSIRALAPDRFLRFSREEGIWEPITLACYLTGLILVWQAGSRLQGNARRHLRLIAGGYLVLVLEEIDYASVFGGLIGRIHGVYAGALHDLIILGARGLLTPGSVLVLALAAAAAGLGLWKSGYIQPAMIRQTLTSSDALWLALGFTLLLAAAFQELDIPGFRFPVPSPEEAIEMAGGFCIWFFALQTASVSARSSPEPTQLP